MQLLTPAQMAKQLNVSESTLARYRCLKTGPAYVKLGAGRFAPVRYLPLQPVAEDHRQAR